MQSTQTASLESCKCPLFSLYLIVVSSSNNSTGKTNKKPEKSLVSTLCDFCDLVVPFWIFSVTSLKDERYFDSFKTSLLIVANTHECNEVLDPNYTPGSEPEEQELFEAKQTFMFSVLNANLQTDMGKTIVR